MRTEAAVPDGGGPDHIQETVERRRRPVSRRAKIVMAMALGSAVIALAIAPFTLMTIPDPHPYRLDSLVGERSGTFVAVADGFYKLYPYTAPLFDFPADAFTADGPRPTVTVKFRQMDALRLYNISVYGGAAVPVTKTVKGDTTLEMTPEQALAPGAYVITAPRDGVDEAIENFYFRVAG